MPTESTPRGSEPTGSGPTAPRPTRSRPGRRSSPPPRRAVDPETARRASRFVLHFTLLLLAALVTTSLPLPWQLGSLGFAIAGLVVGLVGLRRVWRTGLRESFAPLMLFGLVFALLMTLSRSAMLMFWSVQMARQDCLDHAVTIDAREQCEADYQRSLNDRIEQLMDR